MLVTDTLMFILMMWVQEIHGEAPSYIGEPRVENRHIMWDHLTRLRAISQDPWFVCGDYNEAMWQHEHLSRSTRSESQMAAFRDCLLLCELEDLGLVGIPYTYNNG